MWPEQAWLMARPPSKSMASPASFGKVLEMLSALGARHAQAAVVYTVAGSADPWPRIGLGLHSEGLKIGRSGALKMGSGALPAWSHVKPGYCSMAEETNRTVIL